MRALSAPSTAVLLLIGAIAAAVGALAPRGEPQGATTGQPATHEVTPSGRSRAGPATGRRVGRCGPEHRARAVSCLPSLSP